MGEDCFEKPLKAAVILHRGYNYRENSAGGGSYCQGSWNAHHILCCTCFSRIDAGGDWAKQQYVEDCLYITPWNINHKPNMIGLPLYSEYRKHKAKPPGPVNLPAHNIEHNTSDGYTGEVTDYLNAKVWQSLNDKSKKHEHNAEAIKAKLESASSHFRAQLLKRGARSGGTLACFEARFERPPAWWSKARKEAHRYKPGWYKPFSMAKAPQRRSPGVDWSDLQGIFKKLKL